MQKDQIRLVVLVEMFVNDFGGLDFGLQPGRLGKFLGQIAVAHVQVRLAPLVPVQPVGAVVPAHDEFGRAPGRKIRLKGCHFPLHHHNGLAIAQK